ncbi:hypothetical protein KI387_035482 [Taxus chinensis]|uniref:Ionotropic glutamate receptor C-terminal domain-containing protein n=1 Tax=Taxus chinensis TaxID=29808 RepID=A0AA38FP88_TAXCH|nr:hypothetical protein KI387_035482 [Taxus chinensis]
MGRGKFYQCRQLLLAWIFIWCFCTILHTENHSAPTILKIGALICLNSRPGESIKMALELALEKVNEDPSLLYGKKLALLVSDSNCSALQSAASVQEFDAAVGDISITSKRSNIVQFTQPFLDSSLVVVVPKFPRKSSRTWQFLQPFSVSMWSTMGVYFIFTGVVIWILEHKKNTDFQGRPKKQIATIIWFILSTLFFTQREKVKSILGRAVLIICFFLVLIITSSYTANLTSILTIEQLMPPVDGIGGLITSEVIIGYQSGSFVRDYLLELNVAKERLVPLNTLDNYTTALFNGPQRGGVGAIVEERPNVDLLLSQRCEFMISGQEFSKGDWGFAFQKGSQLAVDISTAILKLKENGELEHIHEKWLKTSTCKMSDGISSSLGTPAFLGLFIITGLVSTLAIIFYCIRLAMLFCDVRVANVSYRPPQGLSKCARIMHFVKSFTNFITQEEIPREKKKEMRRARMERKREKRRAKYASTRGSSLGSRGEDRDLSFGDGSNVEDQSKEEYIRWSQERECDWLPGILDQLTQDEMDLLQRAGIWRIARVPHVAPASHILCDLFSYWDADRNTFPSSQVFKIEGHGHKYAWGTDILGTTYHDLYRVVRWQGQSLSHPTLVMSWVYEHFIPYGRGVPVSDPGAIQAARWIVYRTIQEARKGPRGDPSWIVVILGVPIVVRWVVHARQAAGAPRAPLLQIVAAPAHSGEQDEPIDLDFDSEEDTGDETEESVGEDMEDEGVGVGTGEAAHVEEEESDPEWHDTQEMLRAAYEEASAERETLVSESTLPHGGEGDDESVIGH